MANPNPSPATRYGGPREIRTAGAGIEGNNSPTRAHWRKVYRRMAERAGVMRRAIEVAADPEHPNYGAALKIIQATLYPAPPRQLQAMGYSVVRVVLEDARTGEQTEITPAAARLGVAGAVRRGAVQDT